MMKLLAHEDTVVFSYLLETVMVEFLKKMFRSIFDVRIFFEGTSSV